MARSSKSKQSNQTHPKKTRSQKRAKDGNQDEYTGASALIDEQIDKIINHISAKLPPEVLEKLHVGGTIKEFLHNYFNQGHQNMFNRYLVTVEDELAKKFRRLIDRQETRNLNRYTAREIPALLDSIGGAGNFTGREIENSIVDVFGHLQKHIQRGIYDIEFSTGNTLRNRTNIGAFIGDRNSYSIVKCCLRNNPIKPETVTDINLAVNIVESELLMPIYHYQTASEVIIKDIISKHILKLIDREIDEINARLLQEKKKRLSESDTLIEKLKKLENHINFDEGDRDSAGYGFVVHRFVDAIKEADLEVEHLDYDPLSVRNSVHSIVEGEDTRNKGFNTAVNILTGILDRSHLGYQHIQNFRNARKLVIREYADTDDKRLLPDERYSVTLTYFNNRQLRELRTSYRRQLNEFVSEAKRIWEVYNRIFRKQKKAQRIVGFDDVAQKVLSNGPSESGFLAGWTQKRKLWKMEPPSGQWDKISSAAPKKGDWKKAIDAIKEKQSSIADGFVLIRKHLKELYEQDNPSERIVLERRLDFLESSFGEFQRKYNPFHLQAGLVVEIEISTIKHKETTMNGMAMVLNDFLCQVASGFSNETATEYQKRNMEESKSRGGEPSAAGS